ncbi:hypothetical protein B2G71_00340 [Novosphingobium sp. PC22D]|nr:hypothetical protein B2G71_00340 [Novosphingobium sp. PC22D]
MTNQAAIFLPVLALVLLTFVAFLRMGAARAAVMKGDFDPEYYKAHLGEPEPAPARAAARHWDNLFEFPTLFYAACITAFALGAVGGWTLAFAWGFAIARWAQSLVHMTHNNPAHRGLAFVLGIVLCMALWINVAISIFRIL